MKNHMLEHQGKSKVCFICDCDLKRQLFTNIDHLYQGKTGKIIETFHDAQGGDVVVVSFQEGSNMGVHPSNPELRLSVPEIPDQKEELTYEQRKIDLNKILDPLDQSIDILIDCREKLVKCRYGEFIDK
jgi:hypothetical protein